MFVTYMTMIEHDGLSIILLQMVQNGKRERVGTIPHLARSGWFTILLHIVQILWFGV